MLKILSCFTCSYNETAVGNTLVVTVKLFLRNEMNSCIIFIEIVLHCNNVVFNSLKVCAVFGNNKTFSCVFLSCSKLGLRTTSYCFKGFFNGNSILSCVNYTINTSYSIRVTLAYALAPECIICTILKNTTVVKSVEREHTGVPTNGNHTDFTAFLCSRINVCKVLGYFFVGIKAVNNVEILCHCRGLLG